MVVVVELAATAVQAYGAALLLHIDFKLAAGAAALPAVVAVAQPVPALTEGKCKAALRAKAHVEYRRQRSTELL